MYLVNMIKRSSCIPLCSTPKKPTHRWWLELPAAMDRLDTDLHYFATYVKYLFTEKPRSAFFLLKHNTAGQNSTEIVIHTKYSVTSYRKFIKILIYISYRFG